MTRDDICAIAIKAGFSAYISHEHWGDVFACKPELSVTQTEFAQMLTTFARYVESHVRKEAQ